MSLQRRNVLRRFPTGAALATVAWVASIGVQGATFTQASVQPAQPTIDEALTLLLTESLTPNYAVRMAPDSVSISSTEIDITYSGIPTTGYLPLPWTPLQVPLGQLAAGEYKVSVYVQPVSTFSGPPNGPPRLELTYQLFVSWGMVSYAPYVSPTPVVAGVQLNFWAQLPQQSCFNAYEINRVTTSGSEITVNYTVSPNTPVGTVCFTIMPPLVLSVPLGVFPPAEYTVQAIGTFHGASQDVQNDPIALTFTVLPAPLTAVEYYWANADHYFMTADPQEIATLDSGYFPGWVRTGQTFKVLPPTAPLSGSVSPVCRFYGRPEAGLDSHFYSASTAECQAVIDRFSNAWIYESADVFNAYLPDAVTGNCPRNTTPLYRIYNNRPDVNHRYTTSIDIRSQMINAGSVPEGYGANAVAMCVL